MPAMSDGIVFIDAGVVNTCDIADMNAIRVAAKQVVAENQNRWYN
jgi:hypothetical protein